MKDFVAEAITTHRNEPSRPTSPAPRKIGRRSKNEASVQHALENSPLIVDDQEAQEPAEREVRQPGFTIPISFNGTTLQETATVQLSRIAEQAVKAKNNMKRSPWIVSVIIGLSSLGILAAGFFGLVTFLFRLRPVMLVIKLYQMLFALICLVVEGARYNNFFNMRGLLRRFVPVVELNLGRGLLHLLTSGLALAGDWTVGEAVPGFVLAIAGIFQIVVGVKTALQVSRLFAKLKKQIQEENDEATGTGILLIQQRFAALDLNADGKLSKEELEYGCKAFNIELEEGDLDLVFRLLDPKDKGYIGIDDFEQWWYAEKDLTRYIH